MSKKLFSLIHEGKFHLAPKTKRIPAKIYSQLLESKEILQKVKEDAEMYRLEVTKECEILKEQAQKEGFETGFTKWADKLSELEEEIKKVRKEMERIFVPVVVKSTQKIIGEELKSSEETVVSIVANSLKTVSQHKKIAIFVNPKELEILEKSREKLRNIFENLEVLTIQPRGDISEGGCVIETERGIINAQLENQWLILENVLQRLSETKGSETFPKKKEGS